MCPHQKQVARWRGGRWTSEEPHDPSCMQRSTESSFARAGGPSGADAQDTLTAKLVKQPFHSLEASSASADTRGVLNGKRRSKRKSPGFVGRPLELGALLADLRTAKGLSLRNVEEATGKAVSNAYLSQLENGRIRRPSPNVLHRLAEAYAIRYETLMEKAGYLLPSIGKDSGPRRRLAVFAIDDLTAEEEEELLKYLAFLRSRVAR
jgi:transcriptional regulator with XRE-family HTH domain